MTVYCRHKIHETQKETGGKNRKKNSKKIFFKKLEKNVQYS